MPVKKIDDFKPEEVDNLTQEQYDALIQNGEVDVPDNLAPEVKPEITPEQEGGKEPEKTPEPEQGKEAGKSPEEPQKQIDVNKRLEEQERAINGLKNALKEQRIKNREQKEKIREMTELEKYLASLPEGEFIETTGVKSAVLADQKKEEEAAQKQAEKIRQFEESRDNAMSIYPDYQQVVTDGLQKYLDSLPAERKEKVIATISNAEDPAEVAYSFGLRGVSKAPVKQPEPAKVQQVRQPATQEPVILRTSQGSSPSVADKSLEELVFGYSAEQLEKMAAEAEMRRNTGG